MQPVERRLLGHPRGDVRRSGRDGLRNASPTSTLAERPAGRRQPQPRQRRRARLPVGELGADAAIGRDAGGAERHLHGSEQRVDPGQHGDVGRRDAVGDRRAARS